MDAKIYMVMFHVGRRAFNRYFTTKGKAMSFAQSLKDEPKVDLNRGVIVVEEPIDMEEKFHVPKGRRDPQPDAAEVVFTKTGMKLMGINTSNYGGDGHE